jgi:hypothetical protein
MKFGKLFVLFGSLVLIVVIAVCFSMYKMEFFNAGTTASRVRSACDNNLAGTKRGILLLQQSKGSKQHKIGGTFIDRCGRCIFNNSVSNPSKITMSCFCKNSSGVCGSKLSSIDLNIADIGVSPDGKLMYPTLTPTPTPPTSTSVPKTTQTSSPTPTTTSSPSPTPTPTSSPTPTTTSSPIPTPTPTTTSVPKTTQSPV